ncbi:hypothetical protein BT93_A1216 [Corymbia citriodora subsp. variegata]|nr:hypothetical protein BT93_A1216 [Corymbia citriodora subsp. variegata]
MEGWREQGRWLLRLEDFEGHPVGDSFESMLTALGRVARSKLERELSSRRGESDEPVVAAAATASTAAPREGEIMERHGWINKLVVGNPVRVGGKRKATEETLPWDDEQRRCRRPGKEPAEEGIGFATASRDNEEWSLREEKSRGARRKVGVNARAGEGSSKKSKGSPPVPSNPPADMPREFKDRIDRMGGKEVKLVIEKELSRTDLDRHICRVSIPKNQVRDLSFLRDEENRVVEAQNALDVTVIGPRQSQVLKFALVEMGSRKKARPSLIYNFRSGWNNFAAENGLKVRDRIQIWSFRVDSDHCLDRLCFALVKLDDNIPNGGEAGLGGDASDGNNNGGGLSPVLEGSGPEDGSTSTPKED